MIKKLLILATLALPLPAAAKDPLLAMPIDCTLGKDCYIHDYMDRDIGDGVQDFRCGALTRDAHSGTDFALLTHKAREAGVDVLAASPGRVIWVRDGMEDIASTDDNAPDITGKSCGNGVAIRHGGGWTTRYCHLKKDSVAVQTGQRVRLRTPLGQVGMSGLSNYPHLHFTLRKRDQIIDPFHSNPDGACGSTTAKSLWLDPIAYKPAGWLRAGFATAVPSRNDLDNGLEGITTVDANTQELGAWGHFYGVQAGDTLTITWIQPSGKSLVSSRIAEIANKRNFRWYSRVSKNAPWPKGRYSAVFDLIRDGAVIDSVAAQVTVR